MDDRPIRFRLLLLLLPVIFLFPVCSKAQNLVPNPGFEDYYNCPQNISEVPPPGSTYGVKNWTAPGPGTSDYFNTCNGGVAGVPNNLFGYQPAHSGNAYAGCFTMLYFLLPQLDTYREYVEAQLTQPLKKNHLYNVSFYVNTAVTDGIPWLQGLDYSFWATDGVGAYLSGNYISGLNFFSYTPQVQQPSGQILSDTAGWTLVSGYMQGNGEEYITIGNFKKYQQMAKSYFSQTPASAPGAWYDTVSYVYIDDVSVTPIAQATPDTVVCDTVGFSKVLQGYPGGTNYLWNTGDTTAQITVNNTGTYWYQVNFGSYLIKDTINIRYHSTQQIAGTLHDTAICNGTTISVKAPDGYDVYEWHANGTVYHTQSVPVFTQGPVVLLVTDSCGTMADTCNVRFIQQQPLTTHYSDTTVCPGTSLAYTAPPGYLSYQWQYDNTIAHTQSVTITQPGTVVLTVTDSCTTYADTFLIQHPLPLALPHLHDTAVCSGTTINIKAPDGYNTYEWHANGTIYNTQSVAVFTQGTVSLLLTDSCGTVSDSFKVRFMQQQPLTSHISDTTVCAGTSLTYTAPAGYTGYQWQYGNTVAHTQSVTIAQPGAVVLTVTDSCSTYADTFMVQQVQPQPLPHQHDTTICAGTTIQYTAPAGYTAYAWSYNGNVYTTPVISVNTAGKVVLKVSNLCGLQADSFMVGYKQLHPLTVQFRDTTFCAGTPVTVTAPGGYPAYLWLYNNQPFTAQTIQLATTGTVILQVQDSCHTYADTFMVQVKPVPPAPVTADTTICPGAILTVLPVYGSNLLWYTAASGQQGTASIPVIPAGQHDPLTIYVTQTVNGCESGKASLQIGFYDEPQVQLPADTVFCMGDAYQLGYESSAITGYTWSSGETTAFIHPRVTGVYELTVRNQCGTATASANVQISGCDKCFWMPDAFTPNGDGRNDLFGPVRMCPAHFHYYLFRVYNRWGQMIFESLSPERKWDGSYAGQAQPMGTYSYTLEYRSAAASQVVFSKGSLELVR